MTKLEELKAEREEAYGKMRELRGKLGETKFGSDEYDKLNAEIGALKAKVNTQGKARAELSEKIRELKDKRMGLGNSDKIRKLKEDRAKLDQKDPKYAKLGEEIKALAAEPKYAKLGEEIKALLEKKAELLEPYEIEHRNVYGCIPSSLKARMRIPVGELGLKVSDDALNSFWGRVDKLGRAEWKRFLKFCEAKKIKEVTSKEMTSFVRMKKTPEEKEAEKLADRIKKRNEQQTKDEAKLAKLTGKAPAKAEEAPKTE